MADMKYSEGSEGSWREYRLLILDKLETLAVQQESHRLEATKSNEDINKSLAKLHTELATQKVKVGLIGTVSGAIAGVGTAIGTWLKMQ